MQFNSYSLNLIDGIYEFSHNGFSNYTNLDIFSNNEEAIQVGINLSHKKRKQDLFLKGENNPFPFTNPQDISNIFYFILKIGIYDQICSNMKVFQRNPVRISTSNEQLEQILTSDINYQRNYLISNFLDNKTLNNIKPIISLIFKDINYYKFSLPYIQKNSDYDLEDFHFKILDYFQLRNDEIDIQNKNNIEIKKETKAFISKLDQISKRKNFPNVGFKLDEILKNASIIKKRRRKICINTLNQIYQEFLKTKNINQIEIPKRYYSHSIPLKTKIIGRKNQIISSFDLIESISFAESRISKLMINPIQNGFLFNPQKLKLLEQLEKVSFINPAL